MDKQYFHKISIFKINSKGANSYLNIQNNEGYLIFYNMNNYEGENKIYEYYIYKPICNNFNYTINSQNINSIKLQNLFEVKSLFSK